MSIKVRAIYDGTALQLKEPLDLPADTEVELTISKCVTDGDQKEKSEYSFLRTALEIAIDEGPTDWSTRYEEYLYPNPPRSHRDDEE